MYLRVKEAIMKAVMKMNGGSQRIHEIAADGHYTVTVNEVVVKDVMLNAEELEEQLFVIEGMLSCGALEIVEA